MRTERRDPLTCLSVSLAITLASSLLLPSGTSDLAAQQVGPQPVLSGQLRPRFEFRDPVGGGLDDFTSMRVRLGLRHRIDRDLAVFIQLQDVRIWGEETSPLLDYRADNLDLHQGYLTYRGASFDWLTTTIGRMETNFGGQRLVGAVDWTQQGQSFDGVRFDVDAGPMQWALVGYVISDETAPTNTADADLFGAYGTLHEIGPGMLDLYWLYHRVNDVTESDEHALGARYQYSGAVDGRFEFTVERGQRAGVDVSAFMFGGRLGRPFADGRVTVTLWYDYLSGDDPATPEVEVFNTFFGTNHKFYGFADLFLNIPAHTGGAGLQDMAIKLAANPARRITAGLDLHSFRVSEQGALSGAHLADEVDLTLTHRYSDNLAATMGLSRVWQDGPLGEIGRLSEDMTWFYLMLSATF